MAFVQEIVSGSNGAFGSAGSTSNLAINGGSKTVTASNIIVVWCAMDTTGVSTCTDNLSNVYTLAVNEVYALHNIMIGVFVAPVTTGGSLTAMTLTHVSTAVRLFGVAEFSDFGSIVESGAQNTGGSTTPNALANAGDGLHLWSCAAYSSGGSANISLTPPTGFTNVFAAGGLTAGAGAGGRFIYAAFKEGSASGSLTGTIGDTKDWIVVGSELFALADRPALAGISFDGVTIR